MFDDLSQVKRRYEELAYRMTTPEAMNDPAAYAAMMREYKELTPLVETYRSYTALQKEVDEEKALLDAPTEDAAFNDMVQQELRENWQKLGRSEKWIQQRMMGQETRNKLTDYWKDAGIKKEDEFAMLTNIIHKEWSDLTVKEHKALKGLKTQNLRDHMSEGELIFTALAELSTRQIAESEKAKGLNENAKAGRKGGAVAKNARKELEEQTGKSVITGENFLPPKISKKQIK